MSENPSVKKKGKSIFKRWWFWVAAVIVIIAASSGGNSSNQTTQTNAPATSGQTTSQPAPAPAPKNDGSIKAGMYKVGTDFPPGEYVIVAGSSSSYMQLSKDSTGNLDSIICNDMFEHRSIVTVNEGEYFEFKNAKAYPIDKAPKVEPKNGLLQSGMYKVGLDIEPGEYKVQTSGDGYVEVVNDSRHGINSIVSNDLFSGNKYVTVTSGQYIKLQKAELILR